MSESKAKKDKIPITVRVEPALYDEVDRALNRIPRSQRPSLDAFFQEAVKERLQAGTRPRVVRGKIEYETSRLANAAEDLKLAAESLRSASGELRDATKREPHNQTHIKRLNNALDEAEDVIGQVLSDEDETEGGAGKSTTGTK